MKGSSPATIHSHSGRFPGSFSGSESGFFTRLTSMFRAIAEGFPFRIFGIISFAGGIVLTSRGMLMSDPPGLATGILALLFSMAFTIVLYALPGTETEQALTWFSTPPLSAGTESRSHHLETAVWPLPPLFRIHVQLSGYLEAGDVVLYRFRREYRLDGPERCPVPVTPPMPGLLHLEAKFFICDIFGLSKRRLPAVRDRSIPVLPSHAATGQMHVRHSSESSDDNTRVKPADEEKIFIRDYQTGDLARDINWKASSRIDSLLTRIPPESESPSPRLRLGVLAGRGGENPDFITLAELARLKSVVRGYMEQALREDDGLSFTLVLGMQQIEINSSDDLEPCFERLAAWLPSVHDDPEKALLGNAVQAGGGFESYSALFTHASAFSRGGISEKIMAHPLLEGARIFSVCPAEPDQEDAPLYRWFPGSGFSPLPRELGNPAPCPGPAQSGQRYAVRTEVL
ncbi:DUF58 domain-containing protein [Salinispira pacifica]|uniref:Uncharacterized protein n=1 Tax=Salinispira pacifica TaxID=1307761 RepID=V5WLB7_9SPIO|nr:DUF58 domain-containing protein [Salinispira pacifica]AHC15991.1 hypothetical protein L21SP2_2639 [Salinispira pacifica]